MSRDNVLIGEAALALGVTEAQLRRACDAGVLAVPRAGRVRLFPVAELDNFRRRLHEAGYVKPRPLTTAVHPVC